MATFSAFSSNLVYSEATEQPAATDKNNTDIIAPNVKVYIEGVQVPFESVSISQAYKQLPIAAIQIPPAGGLLDITRGYQPKVHIFYTDDITGGDRLLFWGHITACSYSKSRSGGSFINFQCTHKNKLIDSFVLDFAKWNTNTQEAATDPTLTSQGGGVVPSAFNSLQMVITAMEGITSIASDSEQIVPGNSSIKDAPVDKVDPTLSKVFRRFSGMPGMVLNLWNQLKKGCYIDTYSNAAMQNMWAPLLDEGIGYFKRISGHPILEDQIQTTKVPYCHGSTNKESQVMVPPCFRTGMSSAVQQEITAKGIQNIASFSGELTTFNQLLEGFYDTTMYDMVTLASPAEVAADPSILADDITKGNIECSTVETIIKPRMPFYFSPSCNVLLPRMYSSINISQDESSVPTRMTAFHDALPGSSGAERIGISFRGPASIREAVAYNALLKRSSANVGRGTGGADVDSAGNPIPFNVSSSLSLDDTKGYSYSIPGKYEQGQGIRPVRISMPWWLAILASEKESQGSQGSEETPVKGSAEYDNLMLLATEWDVRNGTDLTENNGTFVAAKSANTSKQGLNPFNPTVRGVLAYERIFYHSIDYEFSRAFAGARSGTVDALFNPYIVPGYPMDIVDDSPNHPSFHGMCTSVTHTITSRSISTSIGITAAVSYAELSNYYLPPVHPFIQTALKMVNGTVDAAAVAAGSPGDTKPYTNTVSTLIGNPEAKKMADKFYQQVLGVGAVAPDDLIYFQSGRAYPLTKQAGILVPSLSNVQMATPNLAHTPSVTGREPNDYYSSVGNMRLISRQIERKESIQSKFSMNFIDISPEFYNSSFTNYLNPVLASNFFLEPGASMFLDYMETPNYIQGTRS
jgi:hypothetical protein